MAYNKQSFLSGVAVGRNMNSFPRLHGYDAFAFVVHAHRTERYYPQLEMHWRFDGIIDWGDGSRSEIKELESEFDPLYYHNYENEDADYIVTMYGDFGPFTYAENLFGGSTRPVITVIFIDLEYIVPLPKITKRLARPVYCSFRSFPHGLNNFSFTSQFYKNYKNQDTIIYRLDAFAQYRELAIELDPELFDSFVFGRNPDSYYQTGQLSLNSAFEGCRLLSEIPSGLFGNPDFSEFLNAEYIFKSCSSVGEIPDKLFDRFVSIQSFSNAFEYCTDLYYVPFDLFRKCQAITSVSFCFSGDSKITSDVPDLWIQFPDAEHTNCYRWCSEAANFELIPYDWKY